MTEQYPPKLMFDPSIDFEMVVNPFLDILGRMPSMKITNKHSFTDYGYDTVTSFDVEHQEYPLLQYSQVDYKEWITQMQRIQDTAQYGIYDQITQDARETAEFKLATLPPPPEFKKQWCKFEVKITNGPYHEIDLKYVNGDKLSFRMICWDLQRDFQTELLAQKRMQYLRLIDGCPEAQGHIPTYLFNELVSREVCEFIGAREIELVPSITHRHISMQFYL